MPAAAAWLASATSIMWPLLPAGLPPRCAEASQALRQDAVGPGTHHGDLAAILEADAHATALDDNVKMGACLHPPPKLRVAVLCCKQAAQGSGRDNRDSPDDLRWGLCSSTTRCSSWTGMCIMEMAPRQSPTPTRTYCSSPCTGQSSAAQLLYSLRSQAACLTRSPAPSACCSCTSNARSGPIWQRPLPHGSCTKQKAATGSKR